MGHHRITLGTPTGMAQVLAACIRDDRRGGRAEPPSPNVRFVADKPGEDKWLSPRELNQAGQGDCSSIVRAAGAYDASYVMVVKVDKGYHAFLGRMGIDFAPGSSKVKGTLSPGQILDPCVNHGMNGGKRPNIAYYQGAVGSRIWSKKEKPLKLTSAEWNKSTASYNKGMAERHKPKTAAGRAVKKVIDTAARKVGLRPRPPTGRVTATEAETASLMQAMQAAANYTPSGNATSADMVLASSGYGPPPAYGSEASYASAPSYGNEAGLHVAAANQLSKFLPRISYDLGRIAAAVEVALGAPEVPANDAFLTSVDMLAQYGAMPDVLAAAYPDFFGSGGGAYGDTYGNSDPSQDGRGLGDVEEPEDLEEADFGR